MEMEFSLWLLGGGLVLGLLFGGIIQRTGFCMAAAVSNILLMRDYRQFQATLLAMLVAVLGVYLLSTGGLLDLSASRYRAAEINWLGAIVGGLCFGFGTILAGGCVGRTMVRVGEGNLGALLALLAIAVTAMATAYGPLEPLRLAVLGMTAVQSDSGSGSLAAVLGVAEGMVVTVVALVIISALLWFGRDGYSLRLLLGGLGIGSLVVAGWAVTGYLSQDDFSTHGPSSLAYAGPLAKTATVLATGSELGEGAWFGIALVAGTLLGALATSLVTGTFRWVVPDARNLPNLLIGGLLMGFGALMAGGCNIGQGLSGISTCSIQSLIAVAAIVSGMRLGLAWLDWSVTRGANRHARARARRDRRRQRSPAGQAVEHYRQLAA